MRGCSSSGWTSTLNRSFSTREPLLFLVSLLPYISTGHDEQRAGPKRISVLLSL
ncbi:hypothetical protein BCR35DRAFT_307540, partial [Leucosporidium creatinivorum]